MPEGWEEETKKLTTSANVKSTGKPVEKEQNSIAELPKSTTKPTEDTTKKTKKIYKKSTSKTLKPTKPAKSSKKNT